MFVAITHPAAAVKTHTFGKGDTLWELAAKYYGDPTLYPVFMEVNNIDNPRTIPNGKVIIIPDKNDLENIANESDPSRKKEMIDKINSGGNSTGSVIPEGDEEDSYTGKDAPSREGKVDPSETGFMNILKGPKVSPEQLIQMEEKAP
jgi:LysM repeat protein